MHYHAVPVLEMEAAEGALEGVPFHTPRRVQSLEGAMNDNLKLRFLRDILFFQQLTICTHLAIRTGPAGVSCQPVFGAIDAHW